MPQKIRDPLGILETRMTLEAALLPEVDRRTYYVEPYLSRLVRDASGLTGRAPPGSRLTFHGDVR